MKHTFIIKFSLFLISGLWLVFIFNQFVFPGIAEKKALQTVFFHITSKICHQEPTKLITANLFHSLVCARCAGIYTGVFGASLISLFAKIKIKNVYMLFALLLMALDVLLVNIKFYNYQKCIAFFTGFILGCISFLYLYEATITFIQELKSGK